MSGEDSRCVVKGCDRPTRRKRPTYCSMHYCRLRRAGHIDGIRPQAPAEVRFARYVQAGAPDECWLWAGAKTLTTYGSFLVSNTPRVRVGAHRFAYQLAHGEIPPGMSVMHKCDVPSCVNPRHLELGTHADNMADMSRKGRASRATCRRGHAWTAENTVFLKQGCRRCRQCRRDREAASR